ncbi:arginine--tRNA ligase [Erythrobacter sp. HL-111]|uniref:arginine--tRNA ligase n=1 Tax=Erythrobacter sp. HL-111 TaxID=1798193 RepID=UPI0006DB4669|nr:arginine--tRNA ligase [Erythrobacter sp. HL-111]KPP89753.1 MAG: arginyl-tRNA synthetase ArgS [Erythrobacteraceae bacterium HL-111]SDT11331.1 arginyl-tRNA synthetase [Erythrobacter sp. HL-111]
MEHTTLYAEYATRIEAALKALVAEGALPPETSFANVTLEPPRDPSHGDLATNAAMVLAKPAKTNPRALAERIVEKIAADPTVTSAEIAGPGFINLRLDPAAWLGELGAIAGAGADYGRSVMGAGRRVNVEYVSANPTGPMHMGHCRGAVVGDALASLLEWAGHEVTREYYINDAGGQVDTLARSAHLRYREALGEDIGAIPEGLYPGDYLKPVGEALARELGDRFRDAGEEEWLPVFRAEATGRMMDLIKADLALLGIHHDVFASEAALHAAGKPAEAEAWLREHDLVYDGVLEAPKGKAPPEDWEPVELPLFRSTRFGDDQDRPIRKSNGAWTYFGADLAYHMQKAAGADELIDIWGADHAGTVKRIKAAVTALSQGQGRAIPFDVKLVQMVQLMRGGEPVKMSKRSGNFITIADMVEEVGRDVVRFTMLTRKPEAQMEFDFAKVVEASKDNPVFYVQYAHARIRSTLRKADEAGLAPSPQALGRLGGEELALVRLAARFPREVEAAARAREPHRIAFYLYDLAAELHAFWNLGNDSPGKRFIVEQDQELTGARLFLGAAIGQVIRNGLNVLGVEAVESM